VHYNKIGHLTKIATCCCSQFTIAQAGRLEAAEYPSITIAILQQEAAEYPSITIAILQQEAAERKRV